jgi:hypothetical protein
MSLKLRYQSMDLSASQLMTPSPGMAHRNISLCSLLSVSLSQYRTNTEKNHYCRLSWMPRIIATMLASQDKNRSPQFRYPDAQILGKQKVIICPDIPKVPALPCNMHDYFQWEGHWYYEFGRQFIWYTRSQAPKQTPVLMTISIN